MEHIVLGFDGSNPSFVALDWVAERAARGPSRVEIVTIEREDPLAEPAARSSAMPSDGSRIAPPTPRS